jgi:hypothetical protein
MITPMCKVTRQGVSVVFRIQTSLLRGSSLWWDRKYVIQGMQHG